MDGQAGSPEFVVINQADNWVMLNAYFISECSDTLGIGHLKEAEGQGAGGRGENSPPLLPAPLLLPLPSAS